MKRCLLLLVIAVSLSARAQFSRADFSLTTATGQAVSGAQVFVLSQPANTSTLSPLASVFGSPVGSGTPVCGSSAGQIANPLTTDQFGHACGYVSPGSYTVCYVSPFVGAQCYQDQTFPGNGSGGGFPFTVPILDVAAFGNSQTCTGGSEDDTNALQSAINSTAGTTTAVRISGVCRISNQITLPAGASGSCEWHLVGSSQNAQILAISGFPANTPMLFRPIVSGVTCGEATSIDGLTLNANQVAAQGLQIQSQRILVLNNVTIMDATGGSVGAEAIFGISGGSGLLVGLTSYNLRIDNSNIIFGAGGAAARPNYGFIMYQNASDSDMYSTTVAHTKIAGGLNRGDNNSFYKFHPFGFGPNGVVPNTWPNFGFEDHAFGTKFFGPEFDTIQFGGVDSFTGFLEVHGGEILCNDPAPASCAPFVVQAEVGATNFNLYGTQYQAGALTAPQNPINFVTGASDGAVNTYLTQWGISQVAARNGLHLATAGAATSIDNSVTTGFARFGGQIQSQPATVATVSANVLPADTQNTASVWNGSAPVGATWALKRFTSASGVPSFDQLLWTNPSAATSASGLAGTFGIADLSAATALANFPPPDFIQQGACWNGSASQAEGFFWRTVYGTGANPTETLNLLNQNHCSGAKTVSALFPWHIISLTTAFIQSGVSTNTDLSGELGVAGTTSTYTFLNTYTSHPECTITPQFNPTTTTYWITYSGTTSFTANFSATVSGAVSYTCTGRN